MTAGTINILYLDKEPNNLNAFTAWFRRKAAYVCHTCTKETEALTILGRCPVRVFIADQPTPQRTGMELLSAIPPHLLPPIRIVLSAHRELKALEQAVNEGIITLYLGKPVDFEMLEGLVKIISG